MKRNSQENDSPEKKKRVRRVMPIRRRIWLRVALRWLIMLAIAAAFVLLCVIADPAYRNTRTQQISWGMTAVIYAFILLQSHTIPYTFSKEWTGKVVSREVVKYTKFGKGPFSRKVSMATKCIWTVERDDGYLEKVSYDTDEIWERYFDIGERVRLYKNAKILVKANPKPDDENLMCPLCGRMVLSPVCPSCGVSFLENPPEMENPEKDS